MLAGFSGYEEDLAYLQGQLNVLKAALARVQKYGEQPGQWTLEDLKTRYRTVLSKLDALRREVSGREMPSQFMLGLSRFSDDAIKVGSQLGIAAGNVAGGIGMTAKLLPFILIGALVVLGIGFGKGSLGVQVRR